MRDFNINQRFSLRIILQFVWNELATNLILTFIPNDAGANLL